MHNIKKSLDNIDHRILLVKFVNDIPSEQSTPWKPLSQMHKFGPEQVPWFEQFFTASQVTVSWKKAYWSIRYKNKQRNLKLF